jgi:hypothetical protein
LELDEIILRLLLTVRCRHRCLCTMMIIFYIFPLLTVIQYIYFYFFGLNDYAQQTGIGHGLQRCEFRNVRIFSANTHFYCVVLLLLCGINKNS